MGQPNTRTWKVEVSFSPFANESQKDLAYRTWAKLFVESQSRMLSDAVESEPPESVAGGKGTRTLGRQGRQSSAKGRS